MYFLPGKLLGMVRSGRDLLYRWLPGGALVSAGLIQISAVSSSKSSRTRTSVRSSWLFLSGYSTLGEGFCPALPGRCRVLQCIAALLRDRDSLSAVRRVRLPRMYGEAVARQSLPEAIKRPAVDPVEPVLPQDFPDGLAVRVPMTEHRGHREHCRR